MSKRIYTTEEYSLTEYWGGEENGICIQITPQNPAHREKYGEWIALTQEEAKKLGSKLLEWAEKQEDK